MQRQSERSESAFALKRPNASLAAVAAAILAAVLALLSIGPGGLVQPAQAQSATAAAMGAAVAQLPPPRAVTLPKIECQALLRGGRAGAGVPDFAEIPGAPTEITSAKLIPATTTQPEYCEVLGYVQTQIKFSLKLPTKTWQGRYLQTGCGGWCGRTPDPTFPACRTELGGDFAIAASNDAHDGGGTVWAGADAQTRIDYAFRGNHVLSIAAKAIQKAFYGVAPLKSYFMGCSTGGREGLMEAENFPNDFNGVLSGAPANLQTTNPIFMAWGLRANTDAKGDPILTGEKIPALHAAVIKACDGNDGIVGDGLIGDARDCKFDPASIACPAGVNTPACLTGPEIGVVRTLYKGNFDAKGVLLEPRYEERGMELSWPGFWVPAKAPPHGSGSADLGATFWGDSAARWFSFPIGQGKSLDKVELTTAEVAKIAPQAAMDDAFNTNLKPFRDAGGKLMMYNGWADTGQTPSLILTLNDGFRQVMGGQQELDKFARLFMIPGMGHCGGGPTPSTSDMLLQLVAWVENGQAPEAVVAKQAATASQPALQRPVYRYPLVTRYVGPNPATNPEAPNVLANFKPVEPTVRHVDHLDWAGAGWIAPKPPRG